MYVLLIVVCPFVFFLLVIVLSVRLRFKDSDYPFSIFKLFFTFIRVNDIIFVDNIYDSNLRISIFEKSTYVKIRQRHNSETDR